MSYGYKVKRVKFGTKRNKDVNKDAEKNQANDGDTGNGRECKAGSEDRASSTWSENKKYLLRKMIKANIRLRYTRVKMTQNSVSINRNKMFCNCHH